MTSVDAIMEQIRTAPSRRALWQIMLDFMHDEGVVMGSYHFVDADAASVRVAADGFPEEWICEYLNRKLALIDPIPALAARMSRPFYWHEIQDLIPPSAQTDAYLDRLRASGLGDGLAFYVFGPGLRNAYVGLGFGRPVVDLPPEQIFRLQCVAQAGHLRVCELSDQAPKEAALSPREKQVLDWIAKGKSNSVIAEILAMSPHTVDAHVRSIYRKLDVTDRTSAALRGVGSGVLQYPGIDTATS
ncbi:helix-turn-helix transcriptional regulator [Jannaschia sp. CCS1]|uniref:helix-turn-helix transcriptional regulator n=1 Tax=Jannaschia sp. (strain CCS1) TaxID=290400 RepID=UPI000053C3F5|nr:LuxR family transcriptional regulator [Jannaschia sp. CCS1]ABD54070.1 transcriptional regulator, LuxR family [Jannaschia sp. CCS1]